MPYVFDENRDAYVIVCDKLNTFSVPVLLHWDFDFHTGVCGEILFFVFSQGGGVLWGNAGLLHVVFFQFLLYLLFEFRLFPEYLVNDVGNVEATLLLQFGVDNLLGVHLDFELFVLVIIFFLNRINGFGDDGKLALRAERTGASQKE